MSKIRNNIYFNIYSLCYSAANLYIWQYKIAIFDYLACTVAANAPIFLRFDAWDSDLLYIRVIKIEKDNMLLYVVFFFRINVVTLLSPRFLRNFTHFYLSPSIKLLATIVLPFSSFVAIESFSILSSGCRSLVI